MRRAVTLRRLRVGRDGEARALGRVLLVLGVLAAIGLGVPTIGLAQQDDRPSNQRIERPGFEPDAPAPLEGETGPVEPTALPSGAPLSFVLEGVDFEGNTAFPTERLQAEVASLVGRRIDTQDLLAARDRLTRLYVDAGFATSGATLPDQSLADGRVRFRIVEGRIGEIEVRGARRFRDDYFADRLAWAARAPVDVGRIETLLRRFQRDDRIRRVDARLEATEEVGVGRLLLVVEEDRQLDVRVATENDRSPAVGEEGAILAASLANLAGRGDRFSTTSTFTHGLIDLGGRYMIPVSASDARVELIARWSTANVEEWPFRPLDIESESLTLGIRGVQPVFEIGRWSGEVGLGFDWRSGRSTLDESLFCFQPEVTDCTPSVSVVRSFGHLRYRGPRSAFAIRSTLSWGTGWFGATTRPGGGPDGRFVAWLAQAQWARRTPFDGTLITRFDLQLTEDPLLTFERIAVGGARTVRGYRPNQNVRDSGFAGSVEWSWPVWKRPLGKAYVELAPFFDFGHAWNERNDPGDNWIASAGTGLLMRPLDRVEARLDWGARLLGVDRIGSGLIDHGLHFRVVVDVW